MNQKSSLQPWLVSLSAGLFFFYFFMQANMFNAVGTHLVQAFQISTTQLGNLAATYFYMNVIFLFPAGIILDRFSTRKIILTMMSLGVIATLFFGFADYYWQAILVRCIVGFSGSFCLLSGVRVASRWFPPHRMALVIGVIVALAMFGAMLAQAPMSYLTTTYGWRETVIIDAILGFILLIPMFIYIQDKPEGYEVGYDVHGHSGLGFWQAIGKTLTNSQNWLGGIYVSAMNLPLMILGTTWGVWFLSQGHGMSHTNASMMISILFIGMMVGCTVVGWISDRLSQRKLPMIFGAIFCLAVTFAIMYLPDPSLWTFRILFFFLGIASSFQIIGYPLVAESNSPELTGTAEGIASVLIMSAGLLIPIFPSLLNWNWDHTVVNNVPMYSLANYQFALLLLPIAFLLSLIVALLAKETHCQSIVVEVEGHHCEEC